jgi:hypothetical protein
MERNIEQRIRNSASKVKKKLAQMRQMDKKLAAQILCQQM